MLSLCAQRLKSLHFRIDIIGFKVQVYPGILVNLLQQDEKSPGVPFEKDIRIGWILPDAWGHIKRIAPEVHACIHPVRRAVNHYRA